MYRLATCFWVSLRTLSPQGLSIAPKSLGISILNDPSAVEVVKALIEGNVEYYDINGCRTHKKHKGVNIVTTKNGKTIKIIH